MKIQSLADCILAGMQLVERWAVFGQIIHRGLKLDGAIGQGEICNSLKSEFFSKSFLSHMEKNKIKF